ncbi:MAG: CHAT domain-containing tetratricopeptide repeat protein [Candidatus Krumholzibacteriia bacterium]
MIRCIREAARSPLGRRDAVLLGLLATMTVAHARLPVDQARTLAVVDSLYQHAALDSAQAVIETAIPEAVAAADSTYLLELMVRRGAQLAAFGRFGPAEPPLREALALAAARGDSAKTCQVLRWLGLSLANQGRLAEAEALSHRQLALATAIGDGRLMGWARVALGWYALEHGQPAMAADEYQRAIDLFAGLGEAQGAAWSLNSLGIARQAQGDIQGALAAYEEAATRATAIGYTMVEALAANNLGTLAYSWGDPDQAIGAFRRARALQAGIGHAAEAARADLNVALCLVALGRLDEAATSLDSLSSVAAVLSDAELQAQARNTLGNLRRRQDRPAAAKRLWRDVMADPRGISAESRAEATWLLAGQLAAEDSAGVALRLMDAGRGGIVAMRGSIVWQRYELRRGALLAAAGRVENGLALLRDVEQESARQGTADLRAEVLARMAAIQRDAGRPDSCRAALQRAMTAWETSRDLPLDPEWREARGAAGRAISTGWAHDLLDGDPADPVATATAFSRLQRFKSRTLLERMHGPGRDLATVLAAGADPPASLAEVQSGLDDADLLLDIYLGDDTSLVLAVTRTGCRAVAWPAARVLSARIGFLRGLLLAPIAGPVSAAERTALATAADEVGTLLLNELRPELAACRRLIVCPDGATNLLPWACLTSSGPTSRDALALADRELVTAPSATVLTHLRGGRRPGGVPSSLLAVTAADDLPAAAAEARWLARTFADAAVQTAASPADWRAADVLHLATHAHARDDSPWQSEILLAGGAEPASVTAAAIAGLRFSARLVVLASCESAGGRVIGGEGVQGLANAFLAAGAPAVVATLWPVDDHATSGFMRCFYRELASGRTVAGATLAARQALRSDTATDHPFFWAGFVVVGDGDVTVALEPRRAGLAGLLRGHASLIATVSGVLTVIVTAWRRHRDRRRSA